MVQATMNKIGLLIAAMFVITYTHAAEAKIHRSAHARTEFKHQQPCPANGHTSGKCPGYVIDHVTPLKRGGADDPSNMQWQTKAEAKAKDKWE